MSITRDLTQQNRALVTENKNLLNTIAETKKAMRDLVDHYERGGAVNIKREPTVSAVDSQKGGDHYKKLGIYQPWIVLSKWMKPNELKGFMKGTVIAYLAREEDKGGDLDIEKAYHTMGLYLELKDEADVDNALIKHGGES